MASDTNTVNVQVPLLGILTIVFITLKLCGVIAWSWLWVLSPIWIPLVIVAAIALLGFVIWAIAKLCS